jgi:tol-pal system protein YbgF
MQVFFQRPKTWALAFFLMTTPWAHAGLFDDDEARKAILELRQRVEANKLATEATDAKRGDELRRVTEENVQGRRSLLDLQSQIEILRTEIAGLRGQNEQLTRDLTEVQRRQKDLAQATEDRLRKVEPTKVSVDGREFSTDAAEKRDFETAQAAFRKGEFGPAQAAFADFIKRNPQSGYMPSALYLLGNAQFANREYSGAISSFKQLLTQASDHPKAPEAALSIANCQIELKDTRAARKTLDDLIKVYPQSEAAAAAKERLTRLK